MAAKPPVDPNKLPPKEPDAFPDPDAAEAAIRAAGGQTLKMTGELPGAPSGRIEGATVNEGYAVPPSPIARADRVLAQAQQRYADGNVATAERSHEVAQQVSRERSEERSHTQPVGRNYANEVYSGDELDTGGEVVDMMAANYSTLRSSEVAEPGWFREFLNEGDGVERRVGDAVHIVASGQIEYEQFMNEPMVIRIHSTRDKNESKLVFVGVNGDTRWLPRNKNVRIPRKLVERLAQAQEMSFETKEDPDPTVDQAMKTVRNIAQSYEFSVLEDRNPVGRRWLKRMFRSGC